MLKRPLYLRDRSELTMDPLSDVLSLLKLRSYMSICFDAGGDWSIRFGPHEGIKFYAVLSGACWMSVEGIPEPMQVKAGDCLLLPRGLAFQAASNLDLPPVDILSSRPTGRDAGLNIYNGGGDFLILGSYFTLTGDDTNILLGALPPVVHIHKETTKAELRWCMDRMRQEMLEPQPGGFLVAQQLATMMLVQTLRQHGADGLADGVGWLFALADPRMSAAITAMHADPARRWTLKTLADHAGMSRTSFTLKFKETVGCSPMGYLTHWRMLLAGSRLTTTGDSVSVIARSIGYESESAFSTAFKRVMGRSPRHHGRATP